ncbi:RNA polymerase subunit sigma-70 [Caulobacter sp. Root487D2Y]|uniref:RNA polymerase sigma factor n=1 Tax=Caulobacter sp. Root487D2Y TaxID=1736547 RepID=UPI0006F2A388|nr:RNA polymerase sigma factor [Caulobacter sp. Root487D2Y]KQY28321.1 RNA polymerase subunit sigma-70 [Caulobacter sp. Root487D2Y]
MPPLNAQLLSPDAPPPDPGTPPLADAYLRHRAWLTAVLTQRYGHAEAADIAQDTYLRVHQYVPPAPIRRPKSMLMRIALNLASNRRRKAARAVLVDPRDHALDRAGADGDQDAALIFTEMMLALPPKLRDVFVLTHVEGKTYAQIASLLGISLGAVEKRMRQAVARCADYIGS